MQVTTLNTPSVKPVSLALKNGQDFKPRLLRGRRSVPTGHLSVSSPK